MQRYLNGYIVVKIAGINPEKFINMASKHGIFMWDIERKEFTSIEFKMNYNQFKLLKNISKRTKCKVKIIKRYGMWTFSEKIKRRKFLIIGIVVFLLILYYLSSMVWNINITGNKTIDSQKIYAALEESGVRKWELKKNIKACDVEDKLIEKINEISMVNISFSGTTVNVEIIEKSMPPAMISDDEPCNIVSDKDGIIKSLSVYKGMKEVKIGDYVKKGQMLVSGDVKDISGNIIKQVHSMGDITAETWYEAIKKVPLKYNYEERTGKVKKKEYIIVFDKKLCIKNDNIDFHKYDRIEEKNIMKIDNKELPFEKITELYYEKTDRCRDISFDEAVSIGKEQAENEIKNNMPSGIKVTDIKTEKKMENNEAVVRMLYIAEEKIGVDSQIK